MGNRSGWSFIKRKFKRLMVPWVIAVLTLIPMYRFIFLYSRGLPQEHWTAYFHFTNSNGMNWLWYLPLLFIFNILYMVLSKTGMRLPKLSVAGAAAAAALLGLVSSFFVGSLTGFRAWTHTVLVDFENERLLMYFMIFLLGTVCFKQNVFDGKPRGKILYNVANGVAWIPMTGHIFVRLWPFFVPGFEINAMYRLVWWASFYLSLIVMLYVLVQSFWRYLDRTGGVWDALNRNSYGVYIVHVIVIGVFGTLLLNLNWPVLVKYLLLVVSTYLGSNLLVSAYRTILRSMGSGRGVTVSQAKDAVFQENN